MIFKIKRLDFKTGGPDLVVIEDLTTKKLGVSANERIKLFVQGKEIFLKEKKLPKKEIEFIAQITTSKGFLKEDEIGVFRDVWEQTGWKSGQKIEFEIVDRPLASDYITKKMKGKKLNFQEIKAIISAINEEKLSDVEIAGFVSSQYIRGLSFSENFDLTKAMVEVGESLGLNKTPILDKHSIGGLPGNKV